MWYRLKTGREGGLISYRGGKVVIIHDAGDAKAGWWAFIPEANMEEMFRKNGYIANIERVGLDGDWRTIVKAVPARTAEEAEAAWPAHFEAAQKLNAERLLKEEARRAAQEAEWQKRREEEKRREDALVQQHGEVVFQFYKDWKNHDHTFQFSDDASVWRSGRASLEALTKRWEGLTVEQRVTVESLLEGDSTAKEYLQHLKVSSL